MANHPERRKFVNQNAAAYNDRPSLVINGTKQQVEAAEFSRILRRNPEWTRVKDWSPTGGLYRKIWADLTGRVVAITDEYRSPPLPTEYFVAVDACVPAAVEVR